MSTLINWLAGAFVLSAVFAWCMCKAADIGDDQLGIDE